MTSTVTPAPLLEPETPAPPRTHTPRTHTPRPHTARRPWLGRRGRRVALIAHVLSSVGWFGVAVMVLFLTVLAQGSTDVAFARSLYRVVETSLWVSVSIGAVSGVTGLVLGLGTKWGVVRHWWVVLKEIAFIPLVVTDFLIVGPAAHDAARGVTDGGFLAPTIAHCVILVLATVVSIVKPFGRTPRGRRRVPSR